MKVVPGEDKEIIGDEPKFLDYHVIEQPVFATHLAIQELSRNASIAKSMMLDAKYAFMSGDLEKAEDVYTTDDTVNKLRTKTIEYLSSILAAESITEYQKERVAALLHVASDIEHIGDYAKNIVDLATDKSKKKYEFSTHAVEEIEDYFARMETMLDVTIEALETGDIEKAHKVIETEETINNLEDAIRKEHMERVSENLCAPAVTVVFLDAIHNIERAADSCTNIAEAVIKGYDHKNKYKEEIANA
jgi:phosphate:Na+ symporter